MKTTRIYMLFVLLMIFAVSCNKPDEPNNGGNGSNSLNGHEYVDLGLPSGTLWATCNVGADKPEDFGDYFAWGETTPKTIYNWNTYKYCNGSHNSLTKYCSDPNYGYNSFTDTLTILQPSDDAATVNWGSGWCMPTANQWKELKDNTTETWTTQNDVKGILYVANNGNSIFLPHTGFYCYSASGGEGNVYWSSSLITEYPFCAYYCYFSTDGFGRDYGHTVRPVRSSE